MARISVYRKGSNPAIDPMFLRKSSSYVHSLVTNGDADWWDKSDPSRGAILRSARTTSETSREHKMAAGTMRAAWGMVQSGYAGPLVFQMRKERGLVTA
jgi:hypothetical protein